ncbi:hypothetical protein ACOME3_008996 [Neoechinorhynchus agilis]
MSVLNSTRSRYEEFSVAGSAVIAMLNSILHTPVDKTSWNSLVSMYDPLLRLTKEQRDELADVRAYEILLAFVPFLKQPYEICPKDHIQP